MKKLKLPIYLLLLAAALLLSACSQTTVKEGKSGKDVSVEEILNKAITGSSDLKSFSMNMNLSQDMTMGEEKINIKSTMTSDIITEPLGLHQTMVMDMGASAGKIPDTSTNVPAKMESEIYFTQDGFFMKDPMMGGWIKMPEEMTKEMLSLSQMQQDPGKELEKFKKYVDEFSMKEEGDSYILSISVKGDSFKELIEDTVKSLPSMQQNPNVLEGLTVNQLDYTISVNKKTFYPEKLDMTMDMVVDDVSGKVNMKQNIKGTYSNYNSVSEIKVPDEVKNTAQEMPPMPTAQ